MRSLGAEINKVQKASVTFKNRKKEVHKRYTQRLQKDITMDVVEDAAQEVFR